MFDIKNFINEQNSNNRYDRQLERLSKKGVAIERFQRVIDKTIKNINDGIKSFVIYGEPQSGKTEMMIVLTAKLLDVGNKIVIVLLNDNVELLKQNYGDILHGDNKFNGVTPAFVIWNLLQRYTKEGDLVVDPMCGSGTTIMLQKN